MLTRRFLNAGGLAIAAAASLPAVSRADSDKPLVVFLGNDQCGFCKIWEAQFEPAFQKSAAFKKLDFRVVHPATFEAMLEEKSWPADLQWVLTDFLMSDEGAQHGLWTPRFFLAEDHKIAFTVTGNDGWKQKMWPKILEVTGTKA
jgi:hypothetical protein